MELSSYRNQKATYWPASSISDFGETVFGDPVLIDCRWQDDAILFRDTQGREVTSSAIVYPDRSLGVRGWLALGDKTSSDDPRDVVGAYEIRQFGTTYSLSAVDVIYKAYL